MFDLSSKKERRVQLTYLLNLKAMNYRFARRLALRWAYGRKHQKSAAKVNFFEAATELLE